MKKTQLIRQIVASLRESFGVLEKAARASHAEATHESSKAESKYDTRGLEKIALRRQGFKPFMFHPLTFQRLERTGRLFGVRFRVIDDDDDFADFHSEQLSLI
jgi:hypothetical protein